MNGEQIFGINDVHIYNNHEPSVRAWSMCVNTNPILIQKTNYFNVIAGIVQVS
jgi:hypothetical protein